MCKGKVVLFRPHPSPYPGYRGVSISLLAVAAPLDRAGYDVKIIDAVVDEKAKEHVLEALDGAIFLGITSITGQQIKGGLEVAKTVREKYPKIPIVWGGWHPSLLPEQTAENPYVDIVVRGQGERTVVELANALKNNLPLKNILGITYKLNNEIVTNPNRAYEDINKFPKLPYHLIDVEKFINARFGSRTINYISSRGCPFRCGFCAEYKLIKRRWWALTAERVLDDLEFLVKEYNINGVVFNDSNFFVDEERVKKICKGIIEKNLNIAWGDANARAEQLARYKKETWELMRKSGCKIILIGAESGSQEVLDLINKDATVDETVEFAEICRDYGIKICYSFMLGFPHTEKYKQSVEDEFKATINLIRNIQNISENHDIMWFIYTPYPGTPLYYESIKNGFKEPESLEEWSNFMLHKKTTPWMPDKYVKRLLFMNKFLLPCLSNSYQEAAKIVDKRFKPLGILASLFARLFHFTANFRLKHNFFSFPIEHKLIMLARKTSLIH